MKTKIAVVSTSANGGIRSVVDSYQESSLSNNYTFKTIFSHSGKNKLLDVLIFVKAMFIIAISRFSGYEIYHIHMSMRGSFFRKLICLIILKMTFARVIIHLHGSEFKVFYDGSSTLLKRTIRFLFDTADTVIVLSESWKEFITTISKPKNIEVINNFVARISSVNITESTRQVKTLLFMGKVGERKGAFDLLEAFASLPAKENYRLVMCGDGELEKAKRIIDNLKIENQVDLIGWISSDVKAQYYSKSDIVILPSYNEGLPMTILEAISCGKLVITTPVGGIPEVIKDGENGFLVKPGNISDIKRGIIEASDNLNNANIRNRALETYERRFSPEAILPKIEKIYRRLM